MSGAVEPVTSRLSGASSGNSIRSPAIAWWIAAWPQVSVIAGASKTWPRSRSSK